jgi:hypothetical protein
MGMQSNLRGPLREIFELAWQEMTVANGDSEQRRNDLTQMILLAHRSGLALEQLRAAVLRQEFKGESWRAVAPAIHERRSQ